MAEPSMEMTPYKWVTLGFLLVAVVCAGCGKDSLAIVFGLWAAARRVSFAIEEPST